MPSFAKSRNAIRQRTRTPGADPARPPAPPRLAGVPLIASLPLAGGLDHHLILLLLACTALIWGISSYSLRKQRERLVAIGCALLATAIPLKPILPASATLVPGLGLAAVGALIVLRVLTIPTLQSRRSLMALNSQLLLRRLVEFGIWISLASLARRA